MKQRTPELFASLQAMSQPSLGGEPGARAGNKRMRSRGGAGGVSWQQAQDLGVLEVALAMLRGLRGSAFVDFLLHSQLDVGISESAAAIKKDKLWVKRLIDKARNKEEVFPCRHQGCIALGSSEFARDVHERVHGSKFQASKRKGADGPLSDTAGGEAVEYGVDRAEPRVEHTAATEVGHDGPQEQYGDHIAYTGMDDSHGNTGHDVVEAHGHDTAQEDGGDGNNNVVVQFLEHEQMQPPTQHVDMQQQQQEGAADEGAEEGAQVYVDESHDQHDRTTSMAEQHAEPDSV
jgi:hypothetical protein